MYTKRTPHNSSEVHLQLTPLAYLKSTLRWLHQTVAAANMCGQTSTRRELKCALTTSRFTDHACTTIPHKISDGGKLGTARTLQGVWSHAG